MIDWHVSHNYDLDGRDYAAVGSIRAVRCQILDLTVVRFALARNSIWAWKQACLFSSS